MTPPFAKNDEKIDARILRTRHLLREALIALISEIGYEDLTVQDITKRAQLNRSTFYLHYSDKQDLLFQTARDVLQELRDCFGQQQQAMFPETKLYPGLVRMFEHFARHAAFYNAMSSERGFHRLNVRLKEVMFDSYKRAYENAPAPHNPGVPVDLYLHYVSSAHLGVVLWWLREGMPYTPHYMAESLSRIVHAAE